MPKHWVNAAPSLRIILLLALILLGMFATSVYPAFIEQYYSEGLFPYISGALRGVFNYIPFSIGDLAYLAFIIWTIWGSIQLIVHLLKRQLKKAVNLCLRGIIVFQVLLLLFYSLWGLNYFRQPAAQLLSMQDTSYTFTDIKSLSVGMIDSLNSCRKELATADFNVNNSTIFTLSQSAVKHLQQLNPKMSGWNPCIKSSLFTPLLNYMGTSGYNNPFTGEAQLNSEMPVVDRPITACHEMAHQLGFAREDEANFAGFLAGSRSPNRLLRYSSYYLATEELLYYIRHRDTVEHKELLARLSRPVKADFKADSLYWTHYEGRIDRITGLFYNEFLKANKQPAGLHTYNRMIILLVAWYRQQQKIAVK